MALLAYGAPWLSIVDPDKFASTVQAVADLAPQLIVGCDTTIDGSRIEDVLTITRELPLTPPPQLPDESVLDQIVAATAAPSA
jgi:hypothetical protein